MQHLLTNSMHDTWCSLVLKSTWIFSANSLRIDQIINFWWC